MFLCFPTETLQIIMSYLSEVDERSLYQAHKGMERYIPYRYDGHTVTEDEYRILTSMEKGEKPPLKYIYFGNVEYLRSMQRCVLLHFRKMNVVSFNIVTTSEHMKMWEHMIKIIFPESSDTEVKFHLEYSRKSVLKLIKENKTIIDLGPRVCVIPKEKRTDNYFRISREILRGTNTHKIACPAKIMYNDHFVIYDTFHPDMVDEYNIARIKEHIRTGIEKLKALEQPNNLGITISGENFTDDVNDLDYSCSEYDSDSYSDDYDSYSDRIDDSYSDYESGDEIKYNYNKISPSDSDDEIPILLHSNLDYGTVINKSTIHDKYRGQYFYTDTIRYRYQTLEVSPEVYKSYCRTNKVSPLHCLRTFIAYPLNQYEKCVLMNYYKYNHTLKSQIQWLENNNALENFTERELMSVLSLRRDLF